MAGSDLPHTILLDKGDQGGGLKTTLRANGTYVDLVTVELLKADVSITVRHHKVVHIFGDFAAVEMQISGIDAVVLGDALLSGTGQIIAPATHSGP